MIFLSPRKIQTKNWALRHFPSWVLGAFEWASGSVKLKYVFKYIMLKSLQNDNYTIFNLKIKVLTTFIWSIHKKIAEDYNNVNCQNGLFETISIREQPSQWKFNENIMKLNESSMKCFYLMNFQWNIKETLSVIITLMKYLLIFNEK